MKEEKKIGWAVMVLSVFIFSLGFGYLLGFSHETLLPQEEQYEQNKQESINESVQSCLAEDDLRYSLCTSVSGWSFCWCTSKIGVVHRVCMDDPQACGDLIEELKNA